MPLWWAEYVVINLTVSLEGGRLGRLNSNEFLGCERALLKAFPRLVRAYPLNNNLLRRAFAWVLKSLSGMQFLLRRKYCAKGIRRTNGLGWALVAYNNIFPAVSLRYKSVPSVPTGCLIMDRFRKGVWPLSKLKVNLRLESLSFRLWTNSRSLSLVPVHTRKRSFINLYHRSISWRKSVNLSRMNVSFPST